MKPFNSCATKQSPSAKKISGLYAIADAAWNPMSRLDLLVEKFLEGGCKLIQLRAKIDGKKIATAEQSKEILFEAAKRSMSLRSKFDFTLIINDFADVAFECGADGVHVGENDEPVSAIKNSYKNSLLVGYSSHSTAEAQRAVRDGADYVAIGAVFPTKTKGPSHPVVGLAKLSELCSSVKVPVVAIGGINPHRAAMALGAGASAFAVITALVESNDIASAVRNFVEVRP